MSSTRLNRLIPVSPEDRQWEHDQPVVGSPSLDRLAGALRIAGWEPLELALSGDSEFVSFNLRRNAVVGGVADSREAMLRSLIPTFRQAGFAVGFSEIAIDAFDGEYVTGGTLVGPLEEVCLQGPMQVDL